MAKAFFALTGALALNALLASAFFAAVIGAVWLTTWSPWIGWPLLVGMLMLAAKAAPGSGL
jgi:hypothetical protein